MNSAKSRNNHAQICRHTGCTAPVNIDSKSGHVYNYCSREHALEHGHILRYGSQSKPFPRCQLIGCNLPVYCDISGNMYDYCGRTHAAAAISFNGKAPLRRDMGDPAYNNTAEHATKLPLGNNTTNRSIHSEEPPSKVLKPGEPRLRYWTCKYCTFHNKLDNSSCEICGILNEVNVSITTTTTAAAAVGNHNHIIDHEDSEGAYDSQDASVDGNELDEAIQISYWDEEERKGSIWRCETCHEWNKKSDLVCPQCSEPVRIDGKSTTRSCTACTFENPLTETTCTICGNELASIQPLQQGIVKESSECGLPGCARGATYFGFCSKSHLELARSRNIVAPSELSIELVLVGPTGDFTAHLLRKNHPKHESVKQQFLSSWLKCDDGYPRVERIYWIRVNPQLLEVFNASKEEFGNVKRRFHGTTQSPSCNFGTIPSAPPCVNPACSVCSICMTSFDLRKASRGPGGKAWANQTQQLRYGEGMYFSPVSSKSNDYNNGSERLRKSGQGHRRRWRCMFLCNVVIGKAYVTQSGTLPASMCPPPGFNSVIGETGTDLNYDEVVVYKPNQAIPSYLIVYSLPRMK